MMTKLECSKLPSSLCWSTLLLFKINRNRRSARLQSSRVIRFPRVVFSFSTLLMPLVLSSSLGSDAITFLATCFSTYMIILTIAFKIIEPTSLSDWIATTLSSSISFHFVLRDVSIPFENSNQSCGTLIRDFIFLAKQARGDTTFPRRIQTKASVSDRVSDGKSARYFTARFVMALFS